MNRIIHTLSTSRTALILLLATLLTATAAQTAWAQSSFSGGSGTQSDPYKISSSADLVQLATDINNSTSHLYEDQYFVQTGNINMSGINFVPIGINDNSNHQFRGKYNGQNYTISNLTVNGSYDYAGLFGYIYNGDIDNVRLVSPSITNTKTSYTSALVGFGNMPGIHNCLVISPTLSGGNSIGVFAGGQKAGNIKYTYYTGNNNYSNVGYTDGSNANTSIGHAYALTLSGGATTSTTAAFTYNSTDYYAGTITLSNAAPAGWIYAYTVNGSPINGTSFTINADATVALSRTPDPTHFSDNGDGSYTIKTATGWNVFCDLLADNAKGYFSGKTVRLGDDITVTRMAGGDSHEFTGTFDGDGHTLTVNYANTDNNTMTAPFSYVDGATIQNLIVGGTISGTAYRAAGIIGETVNTTSHITNCVSNVDISSGRYTGGFSIGGNVEIEGCVFNGKINGTDRSGGFIGYSYSAQVIKNSLFAPQDGSSISGGTFYFNGGGDVAPVNSYYTQALGTAQGKACHSVTAGDNVTIDAIALTGTATQYTVSGITAYSGGGLQRGQTLYYGSGDQLSLTLTTSAQCDQPGYQYAYTASAGTLSGQTLTMPDEDVTISVNTAALATIDWATVNQGDSAEDPYMIYNKDQLLLLAHRVNGTNGETANDYKGKYFKLGADITFTYDADEGDDYDENYEAIGSGFRYFRGNFDGDNHTVSGIRIRKTGTGIANNYIGLFGQTGSANIHDVHLTDARIKGYSYVGGIVGYNSDRTTVSGCTVTDSYITATTTNSNYYGIICGYNNTGFYGGHLTNNYYHGCTVNGTAVTSGMGCGGSDLDDEDNNHGALPAYRLALGANITTPPGTFAGQTEWLTTPPVDPRLAPENGFTLAGNHYFASGYVFTPGLTLASGAALGYTPRATLGDVLLDLYTPTGDTDPLAGKAIARLTITADCDGKTLNATLISTRQPVTVAFIKADGTTGEASAIALDGHETRTSEYGNQYVDLAAGWYYVGTDIDYTGIKLRPQGNITLILADGCTMHIGTAENRTGVTGIDCLTCDLTIYGQSLDAATAGTISYEGTGSNGFNVRNYTQQSGNVSISNSTFTGGRGIEAGSVTLNGGKLSVATNSKNAIAICTSDDDITINGGQLDATATGSGDIYGLYADGTNCNITLGWTRPDDRITASSYYATRTVAVATGQALTDGSGNIYTGTLSAAAIGGQTLQPCLALADAADNTDAIDDHAGKTLAVALSGRTIYKDGSWNTLCLPFSISTASGTLSGDNVQAMTLNTTTSNLNEGTLTLNFDDATGQTIPAGTPFIIKWDGDGTANIENPVFEDVTIDATNRDATIEGVLTFTGTYAPVSIGSEGDNTKLYLGSSNTLHYPNGEMTIGCHRAYFQLKQGLSVGDPSSSAHAIVLNFGGGTTSVQNVQSSMFNVQSDDWYTLDGRKLNGKPTQRGIYIHKGNKIVINRL